MEINDIYTRLKNGENFEYKEQELMKFHCSKCKSKLLEVELKGGKIRYKTTQKYLYDDGDTININRKYWLRVDSGMMFGLCENCGEQIALIHTAVLDKNINEDSLIEGFKECFVVFSEDNIIKEFKDVRQYGVYINNTQVGKVFVYKNATINKDSIHGLLDDIERNIVLASLECLSESENMTLDIGVCNGHFERENQYNVWRKSTVIAEELIDSVTEFIR